MLKTSVPNFKLILSTFKMPFRFSATQSEIILKNMILHKEREYL